MADSPTGPFVDLGHPLITESPVGRGQQIDVDVFTDPVSKKAIFTGETAIWRVPN